MTNEIHENADVLMDGEFMLNEFVDRFGPRLAHLNGVLQILAAAWQRSGSGESVSVRTIGQYVVAGRIRGCQLDTCCRELGSGCAMLVDLVQVTASDGVRLHGALETPAPLPANLPAPLAANLADSTARASRPSTLGCASTAPGATSMRPRRWEV